MSSFFPDLVRALVIVAVLLFYIGLLWRVLDWITPFDDWDELFVKGNVAYLAQRVGLLVAQPIAMLAVIGQFDVGNLWPSARTLLIEGAWVFTALLLAYFFVDWVLFPKVANRELLLADNRAVGVVEAGFYIGIGLLLNGSLTGDGNSWVMTVSSTVVFYVLGLAFVMGVYWLHEAVTSYDLRARLRDGNLAAGIELAAVLVSASVVTRVGVAGDIDGWVEAFGWFFLTAATAVVLLYLVRWIGNRLLTRRHTIAEAQEAGSTTVAAFQATTLLVAATIVAATLSAI
ncbi:DUF350 domain-containing protein [Williamsia sp. CHRR-6]|uniref:DUF350 domain-containing protein n=1 Tax=Williamsia sp. CHRR-6 TaxID=2835871 RepID=UPI001BDABF3C|nr:DUF350 domain-containing protein [Williamsia sp. CHRR-6]MBT0567339.1 DUF350 domain-containing protein [Williamsia sp. CHRR-6]